MPLRQSSSHCIDIFEKVTSADAAVLRSAREGVTVQFDEPIAPSSFDVLEREFFAHRPDARLRIYGFRGKRADLAFLERMPSVTRFLANCLATADGIEHVTELPRLVELWIGIDDLTDFDFLDRLPEGIECLGLAETRSKRPSVASVARFKQLRRLVLDAHHKGLDSVGDLPELQDLDLWHYSTPMLGFLERLPTLRKLQINLGGGTDYDAIGATPGLEELHLVWIRRLADLSFLSRMTTLRLLVLDRLAQVRRLPDLSGLEQLERLTVSQLKNLESAAPIASAPRLRELRYYPGDGREPVEDFDRILEAPRLREVHAWLGRGERRRTFAELAARMGVAAELG